MSEGHAFQGQEKEQKPETGSFSWNEFGLSETIILANIKRKINLPSAVLLHLSSHVAFSPLNRHGPIAGLKG